jgi:lipopolysaccharide heptosyltransferase II
MKISANVVTYNESKNIERCLRSLDFCGEIVIIDSQSTDDTLKIAKKYTSKIHSEPFTNFSGIKNHAIDRSRGEWILSVDADEEVTPELRKKILAVLNSNGASDGYLIKRGNFFLGGEIKHCGWDRDYQLRLFKRTKGRFNGKPVHESVKVDGSIGRIEEKILHYSYTDSRTYFMKMNRYTSMQAAEKQKIFPLVRMLTAPVIKFLKMFVFKLGFLDGMRGFILSSYSGFSEFIKFSKMVELKDGRERSGNFVVRAPNWIGDAVMMTAFLEQIKRLYPKLIVVVTNSGVKEILKGNPYIDAVIRYDRKNIFSVLKAAFAVRKEKTGTGVSFSPSLSSYIFLSLSGAGLRAGYSSDMGNIFLNRSYEQDRAHKREHIMEEYKKLLYLVNNGFDFSCAKQGIFISAAEEKRLSGRLRYTDFKSRILVAPFAKFGSSKMWPIEYYSELIRSLFKKYRDAGIFVTGLQQDRIFELGADILENKNFVDMRGSSLDETMTIAKNADYFIGNDSGIMHIADSFGVPMSVIFGSTAPGWGGPVNSKAEIFYAGLDCQPCFEKTCRYGHYNCLKTIKPEDVLKRIKINGR